jgi:hypothetical protein
MAYKECNNAIIRVVKRYNEENIFKIIDNIPNYYNETSIISNNQKDY